MINKKLYLKLIIICSFLLILFDSQSFAADLLIGFGQDRPPYVFGKEKRGLEIDLVREILNYKKHTFQIRHYPNRRLQRAIQIMGVDAVATVRKTTDDVYYSKNYVVFINFAITKKSEKLKINKISDLKGKRIVAWYNAYYDLGAKFQANFPANVMKISQQYYFEQNQLIQNRMFWRSKFLVVLIDRSIFEWYRYQLAKEMNTSEEVVFHDIFYKKTYFRMAFRQKKIRDDFNQGLKHVRKSGIYKKIYKKYKMSVNSFVLGEN